MRLRAAVLTALAAAALAVPAAPAAAAACTQGSGVTVVVDFASLGGGTQTRCAPGDPSSGLAVLRGAGFTPTRAAQEPGYYLCRIDGKPANDPCQRTSPADAYWSYWHAKPGGPWTYSSAGPADYDPARGAVEGWAFGAGKPPSSAPPRPVQSPSAAAGASPPDPAPVVTTPPTPKPAVHASPKPRVQVPSPTTSSSPLPVVAAAPSLPAVAASPSPDRNSVTKTVTTRAVFVPWSVLAGFSLVLLLVAAAAWQVLRRRRESGG